MHKVFISYHHQNDQDYKKELLEISNCYKQLYGNPIFIDRSVNTGDISENLSDERIRQKIRDEYLQDSTVTVLLVGDETKYRKHIDWEIYSSMYNGKINKQSGLLIVNLPSITAYSNIRAGHILHGEKDIYPNSSWRSFTTRKEYEKNYPYLPDRIIDNFLYNAKISVTNWDKITNPEILKYLIDITFEDRMRCDYDLSRPMRRQNFNQFKYHNPFPFSPSL